MSKPSPGVPVTIPIQTTDTKVRLQGYPNSLPTIQRHGRRPKPTAHPDVRVTGPSINPQTAVGHDMQTTTKWC